MNEKRFDMSRRGFIAAAGTAAIAAAGIGLAGCSPEAADNQGNQAGSESKKNDT